MLSGTESNKEKKYHLIFLRKNKLKGKKTYVIDVWKSMDYKPKEHLGIVSWSGACRKYWFLPDNDTGWTDDCMDMVSSFLKRINKRHWNKIRKKRGGSIKKYS